MHPSESELARIYKNFSDDELLYRWRSGTLIESAQKIALQELTARGITAPPMAALEESTTAKLPTDSAPVDFATVATFSMPTEAHVLRAQLEAEGLFVVLEAEHLVGANLLWSQALGGVRVRVESDCLARAKDIVAATKEDALSLAQDEADRNQPPSLTEQEAALLAYAQAPKWLKVWQPLLKKPGFFAGFNFYALLFGATWCLFRKMYLLGVIVFLAEWLALRHLGLVWMWLALRLALGLFGNGLYFMQALNALEATKDVPQPERLERLKKMGGINFIVVCFVPVLILLSNMGLY